jgi:endoglucanase
LQFPAEPNTHALDFSGLDRPGRYRVYVDGVGCSYPFDISRKAWERALRVSLRGFLAQRSGIELGPPLVAYHRPRNMHPADGVKIFASKATVYDGQGQDGLFGAIQKDEFRTDKVLPDAWGGYHDAADWDRRARGHLPPTYQLIELFELFPDYYARLKLVLPEAEANNGIPDILDEAEWNLGLYRRMQETDGGVRGGIESTSHPRKGEASWQESLMMAAFAPEANASYTFAFTAAKFARALKGHDDRLAATYREAAVRAFNWAEAHHDTVLEHATSKADRAQRYNKSLRPVQNLAAVELYWLTGEGQYHEIFKRTTSLGSGPDRAQQDAAFTYARLPDELADATLKGKARAAVLGLARACLDFAKGNSFGVSMAVDMPSMGWVGYLTKPGVGCAAMPRAYYLTKDRKYLAGALHATQFAIGVNPSNITFTTGLGPNAVRYPMYIDASNTGMFDAPPGVTVYGISDPAMNYDFDSWVHTYKLRKMTPKSRTWPAAESYWDIQGVPSTNEYQPHVMAASAYYWGFLAARE